MPDKRRLVTFIICFGSEIAGLLESSYNKYALKYIRIAELKVERSPHHAEGVLYGGALCCQQKIREV